MLLKLLVLLSLCALQMLSTPALASFAGGTSGGGGKAVVITKNGKKAIELLDLWESKELFGRSFVSPTGNLASDVDAALLRLKNIYPFGETCHGENNRVYSNQDCVLLLMRKTAQMFLTSNPNVKRRHSVSLQLTDDSYEFALPPDCPNKSCVIQIVNYQPNGEIWLDEESFNKMNELNQAALIVHESIYAFLRDWNRETNSIRSRRAVGYVFAGLTFPTPQLPQTVPLGPYVQCTAIQPNTPANFSVEQDLIFVTPDVSNFATFTPHLLGGTPIMGTPYGSIKIYSPQGNYVPGIYNDFFGGTCTTDYALETQLIESGPIEFDRVVNINITCVTGQVPKLWTSQLPPGYSEPIPAQFTCWAKPGQGSLQRQK